MDPGAQVDIGQVQTIPGNGFGPWLVSGGPGAAAPAGAEIHVTNLESDLDPVLGAVEPDGSFEIEILADTGDEVRLQIVTDAARSLPVDFLVGAHAGSVLPAPRPLSGCLLLTPALELDTALAQTITLQNGCGTSVQIEQPSLRRAVVGLDVAPVTGWPAMVATGQSITLSISFQAPDGAFEEIVFVRASGPDNDRRPITVWPTGP